MGPRIICNSDNTSGNFAINGRDFNIINRRILTTFRFDDDEAFVQELVKTNKSAYRIIPNNYFGENVLDNMLSGKYKSMKYRIGRSHITTLDLNKIKDIFELNCVD